MGPSGINDGHFLNQPDVFEDLSIFPDFFAVLSGQLFCNPVVNITLFVFLVFFTLN